MRSMTLRAFVFATSALAAACGGSYQNGTTTGGGTTTGPSAAVASVNLVPNTTSLPANADGTAGGATGVTLTAIVLDANNIAVSGAPVFFSACLPDGGTPPTSSCPGTVSARTGTPAAAIVGAALVTDANGVAQATLTTGGNPTLGTVNVTATSGGFSKTVTINVVSATSSGGTGTNAATATNLTIAASSTQLASNASSAASGVTITAFLTDTNRNAVPGVPVTFAASSGQMIVNSGTSDSNGQASATLTTGGDPSARCITVTVSAPKTPTGTLTKKLDCAPTPPGTGISVTSATSGTPVPATLSLLTSSPQLSSNASQTVNGVTLTALVKDANNNVIPGVAVSFTTPNSAAITVTQSTTDASGTATALLTTGGDPTNRPLNITATTSNGIAGTALVTVVGTTLTVSGPSSGQSGTPANYVAVLLDSGGTPIANKPITFTYLTGSATLTPSTPVSTNASGQATVSVTPSTSGSVQATGLGLTATPQPVTVSGDCFVFLSPATNTTIILGVAQAITINWKTGLQRHRGDPLRDDQFLHDPRQLHQRHGGHQRQRRRDGQHLGNPGGLCHHHRVQHGRQQAFGFARR